MTAPQQITFTIDLDEALANFVQRDEYGEPIYEPTTLEHVILRRLTDVAIEDVKKEGGRWNDFRATIRDKVEATVDKQIAPLVEEQLARPFQKLNKYGEAKRGEEITLTEMIMERVEKMLKDPAPSNGSYGNQGKTLLQKLIDDAVTKTMTKEMQAAVDDAKRQVREAIEAEGAKMLAAAVTKLNSGQ